MSYRLRRSLHQAIIKLMLLSLISSTLAGLIPPTAVRSVAPPLADLLPEPATAQAAPAADSTVYLPAVANAATTARAEASPVDAAPEVAPANVVPGGTTSTQIIGNVFRDFDSDGLKDTSGTVIDTGVSGVTVTAYNAAGVPTGSTGVTNSSGDYTITGLTAGVTYRLEFSTLPSGYYPTNRGSGSGDTNGTTVQFVAAGTGNVSFGINHPDDYINSSAPVKVLNVMFQSGDALAVGSSVASLPSIVSWDYANSGNAPAVTQLAASSATGTLWGTALQRSSKTLFTSAMVRRHAGLGPNGVGAIYKTNLTTNLTSLLVDVNTLPGVNVGTMASNLARGLPAAPNVPSHDDTAFDAIGKVGIGQIELSGDERTLFFTNLNDRSVYGMVVGNPAATPTSATVYDIPSTTCSKGLDRPWALKQYRNTLYVGVVCTAETASASPTNADLQALVYAMDLSVASPAFASTPVISFPLNYPKGCAERGFVFGNSCQWNPWSATVEPFSWGPFGSEQFYAYPQPILSDIEFDVDGAMILDFADRTALQLGSQQYIPDYPGNTNTGAINSVDNAGDILRAYRTGTSTWVLESGGDKDGPGPFSPTANNTFNAQGPGGGEFYYGERISTSSDHEETSMGSAVIYPGTGEVLLTAMDPAGSYNESGTLKLSNATGGLNSGYMTRGGDRNSGGLAKASSLGELELLSDPAPIEIGNRVWLDADHDGIQDPDEAPIQSVTVKLTDANGNSYTTVTNAQGEYYFNSSNVTDGIQPNSAYTLTIDTTQAVLAAYDLTTPNANSGTSLPDGVDSDASLAGALATITLTTGTAGQNDHTLDFGFEPALLSLGNRVWYDTNNDGLDNDGASGGLGTGISGVTVQLLDSTSAVIATTTTDANGYYRFDDLAAGSYTVVLPASNFASGGSLQNYQNSTTTFSSSSTDANDNGSVTGTLGSGGDVRSALIVLAAGALPTGEVGTGGGVNGPNGDASDNLSIDFGFYKLTLGNRVWLDANRDGLDGGEAGVASIPVTLTTSAGVFVATTTTDASGYYTFTNLTSGDYIVQIQAPTYYVSTSPDDTTNNTDLNDNGQGTSSGVISSQAFALTPGAASGGITVSSSSGHTRNPTLDFGIYQPSADLQILKSVTPPTYTVGTATPVTYTLVITNYGPAAVTAAPVTDTQPANVTFDSWTCTIQSAGSGSGTNACGAVSGSGNIATTVSLKGGAAARWTINATIGTGAAGTIVNTASEVLPVGIVQDTVNRTDSTSVSVLPEQPLFSVGNRVWFDTNDDGRTSGPGVAEPVPSVLMQLVDLSTGLVVQTINTGANGYYRFDNVPAGDYQVVVAASNFQVGGILEGYRNSSFYTSTTTLAGDNRDHAPNTDPDLTVSGVRSVTVTLGVGLQPTGEVGVGGGEDGPHGDANSNLTIDFGFNRQHTGNQLWYDTIPDGIYDPLTESPLPAGVVVVMHAVFFGVDIGPVLTTTTDVNGQYDFSAGANIDLNPTGVLLYVKIPPGQAALNSYVPTTAIRNVGGGVDSQNTGAINASGVVTSGLFYPLPASTANGAVVTDDLGETYQPTIDFGFVLETYSLGNRLWYDVDNDGRRDASEQPISGVTIELLDSNGDVISTTVTDASGYYRFDNLLAGSYTVRVAGANFTAGSPLYGYQNSTATTAPSANVADDSLDHGINSGQPGVNGVSSGIITVGRNLQPTGEADGVNGPGGDATDNLTIDFGFYKLALGSLVWEDENNNGLFDTGEPGIQTTVRLFAADGTTEILVGPDGVLGTADDASGGMTTSASGVYEFSGLTPGDYIVKVTTLADHVSSTGSGSPVGAGGYEPGVDPMNNVDNDDNGTDGTGANAGLLVSQVVTLTPGATGAASNNQVNSATGSTTDPTVDFGLLPLLSLGNQVWNDLDNSGTINNTEAGIDGVTVNLYFDANGDGDVDDAGETTPIATTTTAGGGLYLFSNLASGNYVVELDAANFTAGGVLERYISSTGAIGSATGPYEGAPDPDLASNDNDDNGTVSGVLGSGGAIRSGVVTLAEGTEPTSENPDNDATTPDNDENLTVDFGVLRYAELGNYTWIDVDKDGVQDAGEPPLPGVTVQLLDAAGNPLATTTTNASGLYTFTVLVSATYSVKFVPPAGYTITQQDQGGDDTLDSDADPTTGQAIPTNVVLDERDYTWDAGFTISMSLGNLVWEDPNDNGIYEPLLGETGIPGVIVTLAYSGTNTAIMTTTTSITGTYLFTDLLPGNYVVTIAAANFAPGGVLVDWNSSSDPASAANINNDTNDDDDGPGGVPSGPSAAISSQVIALVAGSESTSDGDSDFNSNLTIDFGFVPPPLDFGDLPDDDSAAGSPNSPGYNTNLTGTVGASHVITPGLLMGSFEDDELDGQPNADATGDDTTPTGQADDEEGVTIPATLSAGQPADFVVRVVNPFNKAATVYGFIDWNGDGDFSDGSETVSQSASSSGDFTLNFTIPLTATTTSLLGARFRLSTDVGLGPDGAATDGEVEDYLVQVGRYDFGDLPDDDGAAGSPTSPGYNTNLTGTLGASHYIIPSLQLGATEDNEIDGQPDATATGDGADEDAVTLPAQIIAGNTVVFTTTVLNTTGGNAIVYGFIDWNGDGDFSDVSETVTRSVSSAAGNQTALLSFNVPLNADTTQQLGARFRLSTDTNLGADGAASNGEVEDYLIQVVAFDLALRKTVVSLSTTPLAPGVSTVTYNLAVINQGTVTATNIVITDSIDLSQFQAFDLALNPAGTTMGDAALAYTWDATGAATLGGALAPGQTVNLPVTLRIAANTLGKTLANYAEIASATDNNGQPVTDIDSQPENTEGDGNGDNLVDDAVSDNGTLDEDDHDVAYVSVKRFDLALVKTASSFAPAPLTPGVSVVTFTLSVFNQGDLTTTLPITVVDYPQTGLTFNAADNPAWDGTDPTKPQQVLTTPIGPGGSLTTTIVLRVDSAVTGGQTLYNFAEIAGDGAPVDADSTPDNSNDEAGPNPIDPTDDTVKDNVTAEDALNVAGEDEDDHDVATLVVPVFDLALIKTVGTVSSTPIVPGSTIVNFNLTVYNQGEVTAQDITLVDYVIPADYIFDAALNPAWSAAANPAITLPGPLAPGAAVTTTIILRVAPGSAGQLLENYAEISDATDPNGNRPADSDSTPDSDNTNDGTPKDNNTAEDHKTTPSADEDDHDLAVLTAGAFDLALVKRVAATDLPLLPNGLVTFTVEVFNQGDIAATDSINLVDYVQTGFTFDPALNPSWNGTDPANPVITITADIAPGASVTVPLVLRVNTGTAGQTLNNYAEIAADGIEPDRDSTPDATNSETPVKDDVTLENGLLNPGVDDEDDHDIASVTIPLPVALGNYVWLDLNRDGLQTGENGLAGATVELFQVLAGGAVITPAKDIDGVLVPSLTTGADGLYQFSNLAPGEYLVRVTPPAGYGATQDGGDPDNDANTDSNGIPVAGQPYVVSLPVLLTVGGEPAGDDVSQGGIDANGNGTVDFGFVERRDWGDLPDGNAATSPNYNTNSTGVTGPSHLILPGLQIGTVEDDEVDGQPSATATGDDNIFLSQPDDEDGVTLPGPGGTPIIANSSAVFTVTLVNTRTAAATLYGFVDWNGDGDFGDLGEAVSKTVGQSAVSQSVLLTFTVPATATTTLELGARFRLSSDAALGPDGAASDGEVEDYLVKVTAYDWGDLPDGNANNSPNYPTSDVNNGPRHQIVPGLGIGPVEDNEIDGQPNSTASGDDNAGLINDEDGVQIPAGIQQGQSIVITVTVVNTTGRSATLYGFIDWNGDGDFADSGESVLVPANASGPALLSFNVPLTATITQPLGARFRLSSDAGLGPVGVASDGEVEDYLLAVSAIYDWGDLPADYHTLAADGGPSHAITPTLRLGTVEDNEADGQPDSTATGDDVNLPGQPDDEDGMILPGQFVAGASATVTATVFNNTGKDAIVYGFIDWNGDGDFADLGETQTANVSANAASQNVPLNFSVPATATTASLLGARFRLSTDEGLGPDGPATDGEVEDYLVTVTAYDYGDLPDDDGSAGSPTSPGYNTNLNGTAGAAHVILPGLKIGASEDAEADGQPDATATGDDTVGSTPDDEDGVTFPASLYPGQSAVITVTVVNTTGQAATLYAFIDWNGDGDFADAGESVTAPVNASGNVLLNFNIPATATITQSVGARFRLSTDSGLGADGLASNGEVEDYLVELTPPLSLGNRVWEDANNNGLFDTGESGIEGVRVKLYQSDGITEIEVGPDGMLGTADDAPGGVLTNATGHYLFAQLPPGDYIVEVTQPAGYTSSTGTNASSSGAYEPAPDEDTTPADGDDNGTLTISPTVRSAIVTLVVGGEPTGETDLGAITNPAVDNNSNLQVDFGFYQPLSLGNEVWIDVNNDGLRQVSESYVPDGVKVNLYFDADGNGQLNGGETTAISSTTTLSGLYLFAHLRAGNYLVELDATNFQVGGLLVGYASSIGQDGVSGGAYEGAATPDPDANATDGDDNGSTVGVLGSGGSIRSALVTLTVGDEPNNESPDNDSFTPDRNENLTVDFGVFRPLSLGNLVWNDVNNDGLYDADGVDNIAGSADDEGGLNNVVVELLDDTNTVISTTNTANGGRYLFPNLTPGDYSVRITPPPGYLSSTGVNGQASGPYESAPDADAVATDNDDNGTSGGGQVASLPVTLAHDSEPTGENPDNDPNTPDANENLTVDFGLFLPASLGNYVWLDTNKDGVQDGVPSGPELGVPGVVVNLYTSSNTLVLTTTTSATGNYTFTNLIPGDYYVQFDLPLGYARSPQDNGGSGVTGDQIDSDADVTTGRTIVTTLTPGENDPTWDAGIYYTASLGDRVWFDQNGDGVQDAGEPGVPNVTVTLFDSNNNPVGSPTQTDADGFYSFTNLPPGDYYVQFTPPAGYVISPQDTGGNTVVSDVGDSDANPADGKTIVTTLTAGEADPTWDAGIYLPVSLGNLVWEDKNNNGLVDAGEAGIPNVPVKLFAADGTTEIPVGPDGILGTADDAPGGMLTNASGNYLFANLPPGDYVVGIVAPAGYTSSTGVNGSASGPYEPASDPDNNVNNDDNGSITSGTVASGQTIKSAPITLISGGEPAAPTNDDGDSNTSSNLSVDFGLYQPLSLGNLVWYDADNSGTVNNSEQGIPNVTVQLYAGDGTTLITSTQTNSTGHYLFTNLTAGDYVVAVLKSTVPAGYVTSTGTNGSLTGPNEPAPDEDSTALDNDDNGSSVGPLVVTTAVTLSTGGEPTGETDAGDITNPSSNANSNTQVDFGFYVPLSLGNLVWEDKNNNGKVDAGEPGLDDVVVTLYAADGITLIAQTTTDNTGHYRFDNLAPGDYVVAVEAPISYISSTGANGKASGPYEAAPDPDNDVNGDDNGTTESGEPATGVTIFASPVTLSVGGEPAAPTNDDEDNDPNSNLSVDFGLFQPLSLGNLVWHDVDNDGKVDSGETGIPNVTVNLYGADGVMLIASTTTNATGHYLFTHLIPGDYIVEVVQSSLPAGYVTSTGKNGSATGPYESAPDEDSSPLDNDDNGSITSGTLTSTLTVRSGLVTLSANSEPKTEPDAGDIFDNAQDGNSNLQVDFGFFIPARLGDRVWLDHNRDGVQDTGEVGVNGVTVRLYDSGNNLVATTTTGNDGLYLFDNLSPGDYVVEFALPIGYARSPQDTGGNTPASDATDSDANLVTGRTVPVNLSEGETDLTWDAGIYFNASLGDRVWYDRNGDGVQDAGEPGVPGVQVTLFNSLNQPVGDPVLTDANGNYAFHDLPPGDYYVQFTLPGGYIFSPQDTGGNTPFSDALDSDVNPLTGKTIVTNLGLNEHDPTWDAGIYEPVSLGNLVWEDLNNNGKVDVGEAGIPNVTVRLYKADGTPVGTPIQTDVDGHYLFPNLPPGKYYVEIDAPAGYATSTGLPGSYVGLYEPAPSPENNVNHDDNGSNTTGSGQVGGVIRSTIVTLTPGQEPVNDEDVDANSNLTVDFGLYRPVMVGDFVWVDKDGDGVQEAGEPGVPNVKVTLYNAATDLPVLLGGVPLTDLTDANGLYLFENLPPGDYYVVFDKTTLPAGHIITQPNVGTDDKDSDADSSGRTPSTGFLPSGSADLTLDLGIYQPVTVGDYVWIDGNDNSQQDSSEPGVAGVKVTLYDATTGAPVLVDGNPLTDMTDGSGQYLFPNLPPGNYYVVFDLTTLPAGYVTVLPNQGTDDKDSDADSSGKTAPTGFLESGQSNLTLDLGIQLPPNLVLTKTVAKTVVAPGEVIVYTLTYTNTGPSTARSSVLTETVPTGMSFEASQSTAGWQCTGNGAAGATCRFTLGNITPGQSGKVLFALKLGSNVSSLTVIPNVALIGSVSAELTLEDNGGRADIRVQTPQAVSLALFSAEMQNGVIVLRWQTSVELRTAGYHIYRSTDGQRRTARQITTGLIPSLGLQGGDYSYTDREVELNQVYTYWLVEVDTEGQTHEYGPIRFGVFANSVFLPQIGK